MADYYTKAALSIPMTLMQQRAALLALELYEEGQCLKDGDEGVSVLEASAVEAVARESGQPAEVVALATKIALGFVQRRLNEDPDDECQILGFDYCSHEDDSLCIRADESIEIDSVIDFVYAFLQAVESDEVIAFEWASACSRTPVDAFGGGAACVSRHGFQTFNTSLWACETTKAMRASKDGQALPIEPSLDAGQRTHVTLPELGFVTVNRTEEGLIIDVHNLHDSEAIASVGLMNSDFDEGVA